MTQTIVFYDSNVGGALDSNVGGAVDRTGVQRRSG
jgi:hypothetical protein